MDNFRTVAYFKGYGFGRPCLYQDALQIDNSHYTDLHFAFAALTTDFKVQMGADKMTKYEFDNFKRIKGPAKILSFGGWDFSTDPSTYFIFRHHFPPNTFIPAKTEMRDFTFISHDTILGKLLWR